MPTPVALQLWSVREDCAHDFLGTLTAVAEMGYDGVEFAGYHGVSAPALSKALSDRGLTAPSAHTAWASLQPDTIEATILFHKTLGCPLLIVPGIAPEMRATKDACLETADRFTSVMEHLRAEGLRCGYHCHAADMQPLPTGERPWDVIAQNTPDDFVLQYDTANGMSAGASPFQPILDYPGRTKSLHVKEHSAPEAGAVIGEGEVPWSDVLAAAKDAEWLVVEHEQYGSRTPLEGARLCLEGLRALQGS
ncbi:MAG: sugar phosphate isomerase/epimerase [Fimbriimonadaceae bacterium]|nr:sugar phosphate isomerase/epimerase [Fimbriimonadaceae bacterium]